MSDDDGAAVQFLQAKTRVELWVQKYLDDSTPYIAYRWISSFLLLLIFSYRVYVLQGFYIVTYALAIYMLNLLLAFLSPKLDPAVGDLDMEGESDEPALPTQNDEEFRPFVRRLPEFKFWLSITRAILVALICTFFRILDIPVFWPILLIYFVTLFFVTMKRQIMHMYKYRYLPFDFGKRVYQSKD